MSGFLYRASVPVLTRALGVLSALLAKGEAYAAAEGIAPDALLQAQLAPDMFPLLRQVQIASDGAKGAAARLAGREIPSFADTETSFAELQQRIARTVAFLEEIRPEEISDDADRSIVLTLRSQGGDVAFTPERFLLQFALPNFFFHIVTAYDILRHKGVAVGKMDYLGTLRLGALEDAA